MAIKRVPRQTAKAAPREVSMEGKRACETCGKVRPIAEFGYVQSSLLDPTLYFCGLACWAPFQEEQSKRMGRPLD